MPQFLLDRPWAIYTLLILIYAGLALFLAWGAMRIVGGHFKEFLEYLAEEREDSKRGRKSLGALNWKCVSLLTVFGVLIIVVLEFHAIFGALKKWLGTSQTEELHKSADISNFFFTLAFVIVVSVVSVFLENRQK